MELVEGEALPRGLPPETALNYARQIAEALEYAHERGIVHRDLKPANIKVTDHCSDIGSHRRRSGRGVVARDKPVDHSLLRLTVDVGPDAMTGLNLTAAQRAGRASWQSALRKIDAFTGKS